MLETSGGIACPVCRSGYAPGTRFCGKCGSLLQGLADKERLLGRTVAGRYVVRELLAIGGMGRIYAADQDIGGVPRRVALKVLLAEYASCRDIEERFLRECATVTQLEHPNTVKIHDYGKTEDGDLFIAMELVRGDSLADVMEEGGPLPAPRLVRILGQICGALEEAHARGFVHRDLKPDNILLASHAGQPDFVKVLDFGIARDAACARITEQGLVIGSPPYMSPEQFSDADVDARSDVYSLGVVAFKALVGRAPFDAQNPADWATQHILRAPLPFEVTAAGARVPAGIKRAVMRALSKNPAHRPQSMAAFHAELTAGMREPAEAAVVSRRAGPATVRRGRYRRICGTIVALACGVLALAAVRRMADAGSPAAPPEPPRVEAPAPPEPPPSSEPSAPPPAIPEPSPTPAPRTAVRPVLACEASIRSAWVNDCASARRYLAQCRAGAVDHAAAQSTFAANCR